MVLPLLPQSLLFLLPLLLLQLLLGLQLVYLAYEILEDNAAFRTNALLKLVNDFLRRPCPIELARLTEFDTHNLGQRYCAGKECCWLLYG
jgi:hypothetical protein